MADGGRWCSKQLIVDRQNDNESILALWLFVVVWNYTNYVWFLALQLSSTNTFVSTFFNQFYWDKTSTAEVPNEIEYIERIDGAKRIDK